MFGVNFNRQQWLVTITFVVVNFCNAMTVSMQAPFYPHEAEKKGCVPSEYGLVFGIFELTVFLVSPVIGANLNRMGMKFTLNVGIATVAVSSILFGLLDKINDGKVFLGLSFALRIIEACGNSAFLTGSFSMIAKEFPENVATMFAILETFFGIGMIVGPTVGGALYQAGGFTLPFVSLGGVLLLAAVFTACILPNQREVVNPQTEKPSVMRALKVPSILMAAYNVAAASASLGFLQATLEPHMREFNLSPLLVGSMFVINGACYGISAPLWGYVCDRKPPTVVMACGAVCILMTFSIIGPLPFFPFQKSLGLIIGALVLQGIGLGAQVVSGFAESHKQAIASGFPDNIDTHGLISGLWTSVFALGAFVGPTLAGILFDAVGFPWATVFVIVAELAAVAALFIGCMRSRSAAAAVAKNDDDAEGENLIPNDGGGSSVPGGYGATGNALQQETGEQRRARIRARGNRTRKYSEVVSGSMSRSLSQSMSRAYPQFALATANSYRQPPPSFATGAIGGSVVDRHGADNSDGIGPVYEIPE